MNKSQIKLILKYKNTMPLKTYIISEKTDVINTFVEYIEKFHLLSLVGFNKDAVVAQKEILSFGVELLFIDTELANNDAFSISKAIHGSVIKIFLGPDYTSSSIAFQHGASGFLLKAVCFSEFLNYINPLTSALSKRQNVYSLHEPYIYISEGIKGKFIKLTLKEIFYIESNNNSIIINMENESHKVYFRLKGIMKYLPKDTFIRIHKSFIVNHNKIDYIEGNIVKLVNKTVLVLGTSYKNDFFSRIQGNLIKNGTDLS